MVSTTAPALSENNHPQQPTYKQPSPNVAIPKQTSKYQEILWTVMHSAHFRSRHSATHSLTLCILMVQQQLSQVLLLLQNGTLTFVLMKAMNSPQTFTGTLLFLRVACRRLVLVRILMLLLRCRLDHLG